MKTLVIITGGEPTYLEELYQAVSKMKPTDGFETVDIELKEVTVTGQLFVDKTTCDFVVKSSAPNAPKEQEKEAKKPTEGKSSKK